MIEKIEYAHEQYVCRLLSAKTDISDVDDFLITKASGKHIEDYIKDQAFRDQRTGVNRTYLVRDIETNEIAGFFSLKAGMAFNDEVEDKDANNFSKLLNILPGVELSYLGVNENYVKQHADAKGLGAFIFKRFVFAAIADLRQFVGVRMLYGFSVENEGPLMDRYLTVYGFARMPKEVETEMHQRLRPNIDDDCTFVYMFLTNVE